MIELTRSNFKAEVEEAELPVLIDFYATWCAPCKAFAPVLEQLAAEYGDRCKFCKADIDQQEGLAHQFDIMSVPTLLLLHDGEVQQRISGLRSREDILEILGIE